MKKFEFDLVRKGHSVTTRDGEYARVICVDRRDDTHPVVALVGVREVPYVFTKNGELVEGEENDVDLFMDTKYEGEEIRGMSKEEKIRTLEESALKNFAQKIRDIQSMDFELTSPVEFEHLFGDVEDEVEYFEEEEQKETVSYKTTPFDLNLAKVGQPVVTTTHHPVRILSFDVKNTKFPLVGILDYGQEGQVSMPFTEKGEGAECGVQLRMLYKKEKKYVVVFKEREQLRIVGLFDTFTEAKDYTNQMRYLSKVVEMSFWF